MNGILWLATLLTVYLYGMFLTTVLFDHISKFFVIGQKYSNTTH